MQLEAEGPDIDETHFMVGGDDPIKLARLNSAPAFRQPAIARTVLGVRPLVQFTPAEQGP